MVIVPLSLVFRLTSIKCAYGVSHFRDRAETHCELHGRLASVDQGLRVVAGGQAIVAPEIELFSSSQWTSPQDLQLGLEARDLGAIRYVEHSPPLPPRLVANLLHLEHLAIAMLCHRRDVILQFESSHLTRPSLRPTQDGLVTLSPGDSFAFRGVSVQVESR
jgi:hypothetical protein